MQVGAPFTQLPVEVNELILQRLNRNEIIPLRLVNKNSRKFIDIKGYLKTFASALTLPPPGKELKIFRFNLYASPVLYSISQASKLAKQCSFGVCIAEGFTHGFIFGLGLFLTGFLTGMVFTRIGTTLGTRNIKIIRWVSIPVEAIILSTAKLYSHNPMLLGCIYLIQSVFTLVLRSWLLPILHTVGSKHLDLSHVNPNKFSLLHRNSEVFALRASYISHIVFSILVNPIFAVACSVLTITIAKLAYIYYQTGKAAIQRI